MILVPAVTLTMPVPVSIFIAFPVTVGSDFLRDAQIRSLEVILKSSREDQ
jgi:hypothetical protein